MFDSSDYQYNPVNFLGLNICVLGSLVYTKVSIIHIWCLYIILLLIHFIYKSLTDRIFHFYFFAISFIVMCQPSLAELSL